MTIKITLKTLDGEVKKAIKKIREKGKGFYGTSIKETLVTVGEPYLSIQGNLIVLVIPYTYTYKSFPDKQHSDSYTTAL
jgi:hypothetical protein